MSSFHPIESIFTPVSLIRNHSNFSTTSTTTKAKSEPVANPNPRSTTYEFMGPPGTFLISFGVPFMMYLLYFGCSEESGNCPPLQSIPDRFVEVLSDETFGASLWNTKASLIYLGCFFDIHRAMGISLGLITASLVISLVQAFYVHASSYRPGLLLALGGNLGDFVYDWYIGRELTPSVGSFDIKSFNELRPDLTLWVLVNMSMVCEQAVRHGDFTNVIDSMCIPDLSAIFTSMDIITDSFGFIFAVGDLTWVPFVYSLQAHYLVFKPVELGPLLAAGALVFNLLGYYIFCNANGDKMI
ncbi:ergosterol biosynthesis ERG4/ERG24 family-domain-containing protein [Suillus cothurnatus]|nr:ergosterol biosynthesis ERG4/ERG24 family-domain-containing protein [Suillus cothurnatus]